MTIINRFLGLVSIGAAIGLVYYVIGANYAGDVAYEIPIERDATAPSPEVLAYLAQNQSLQTGEDRDPNLQDGLTNWFDLTPEMETISIQLVFNRLSDRQQRRLRSQYARQMVVHLLDEDGTAILEKDDFFGATSTSGTGVSSSVHYSVGQLNVTENSKYRLYYRINTSVFSRFQKLPGRQEFAELEIRQNITYPNIWILIISGGCFVVSAGLLIILRPKSDSVSGSA